MRLNTVVDEQLLQKAMEVSGLKTKKEVVESALRLLIQVKHQHKILQAQGKLHWEGDLDEIRTNQ